MQKIQIKLLALFFLVLFAIYGFQPSQSVFAEESNELKPFKDLKVSDWGIHIYFDFSNVTFSTDGTGPDLGNSQPQIRLKPNPDSLTVLNNIRFGVTDSETLENERYPQGVIKSTKLKAVTTNTSAQDTFEFEDQILVDYSIDVETAIGSETVVNHTLMEEWADSVDSGLENDYVFLNETLYTQSRNFGPENGYFNGRANRIQGADYKTVIVGYRNFEQGALSDLKGYISTITGVSVEDIRINSYYFDDAKLTFNTSTRLNNYLKYAVDWALEKNNLGRFKNSNSLNRLKLEATAGLFDGFMKDLGGVVNGITTTVGSAIDHFIDDPIDATLGTVYRGYKDVADVIGSNVGPLVMGAVNSAGELVGGIGKAVGDGVGGLVDAPFGQFAGLLGDIAGQLLPILIILVIVGVIVFLAYVTLRSVLARQAANRL